MAGSNFAPAATTAPPPPHDDDSGLHRRNDRLTRAQLLTLAPLLRSGDLHPVRGRSGSRESLADVRFGPVCGLKSDTPQVREVPKGDICTAANCGFTRSPRRRLRAAPKEWRG